MFEISNWDEVERGLKKFEQQLEKSVEDFYRGWTVKMFQQIVWTTPQWSGNAVANWNYSLGQVDSTYTTQRLDDYAAAQAEGQQLPRATRGDGDAVNEVFIKNEGRDAGVKFSLGGLPEVFIHNPSQNLTGKAYASFLEANESGFLRVENEPGHMVQRAAYRFGNMGTFELKEVKNFNRARI